MERQADLSFSNTALDRANENRRESIYTSTLGAVPGRETEDDVVALCSQAGLGVDQYQAFDRLSTAGVDTAFQRTDQPGTGGRPPVSLAAIAGPGTRMPATSARVQVPSKHHGLNPLPPQLRQRWGALRSVFEESENKGRPHEANGVAASRLPAGSVCVLPCGGGVGTTTIIATLGRIFALRQESVLLLDGNARSVLPYYFGAAGFSSGAWLFQERLAAADRSIRVISRRHDNSPHHGPGAAEGRESDESLFSNLESHLAGADRVLVDAWSQMADTVQQRLLLETNALVVLVADLRSVLQVRSLLQFFEEQERASGRNFTPHFLINQFDPSLPLHQELLQSLSAQLGERLLPFTLRRSDEISLALAEGATVVDYAPDSEVAQDFMRLANWVAMWQGTQTERESRTARA